MPHPVLCFLAVYVGVPTSEYLAAAYVNIAHGRPTAVLADLFYVRRSCAQDPEDP